MISRALLLLTLFSLTLWGCKKDVADDQPDEETPNDNINPYFNYMVYLEQQGGLYIYDRSLRQSLQVGISGAEVKDFTLDASASNIYFMADQTPFDTIFTYNISSATITHSRSSGSDEYRGFDVNNLGHICCFKETPFFVDIDRNLSYTDPTQFGRGAQVASIAYHNSGKLLSYGIHLESSSTHIYDVWEIDLIDSTSRKLYVNIACDFYGLSISPAIDQAIIGLCRNDTARNGIMYYGFNDLSKHTDSMNWGKDFDPVAVSYDKNGIRQCILIQNKQSGQLYVYGYDPVTGTILKLQDVTLYGGRVKKIRVF